MKKLATLICFLMALMWSVTAAQAEEVDLELVLAMDTSGSISVPEYLLQLEGTANAFRDPAVQTAITSGPNGRIAVTVLLWSDAAFPKINSGWFLLDGPDKINRFADIIQTFRVNKDNTIDAGGMGTGIGAGIQEGLRLLNSNKYKGLKRVIDVSGDGIETTFWFSTRFIQVEEAKKLAETSNVTVNGLPILNEDFPELDKYYREQVITGPGSFIVPAKSFADFARAIRQKLLREISSNLASVPARAEDSRLAVTPLPSAPDQTDTWSGSQNRLQ